jgi:hypothetical protein
VEAAESVPDRHDYLLDHLSRPFHVCGAGERVGMPPDHGPKLDRDRFLDRPAAVVATPGESVVQRPGERARLRGRSNERLKSETGWRPSMNTREVFELTMRAKGRLAATVAAAV